MFILGLNLVCPNSSWLHFECWLRLVEENLIIELALIKLAFWHNGWDNCLVRKGASPCRGFPTGIILITAVISLAGEAHALPPASFALTTNYSVAGYCKSVAIGDFNHDGKPDLVVILQTGLGVLLANGDGTFVPTTNYFFGGQIWFVLVADVNMDGRLDLIATDQASNTVNILLGRGDGTFLPAIAYDAGGSPRSVEMGDINGDGKPDLITANQRTNTFGLLLGDGNGAFKFFTNYSIGGTPRSVQVGDFMGMAPWILLRYRP